jgi:hypothetical protein
MITLSADATLPVLIFLAIVAACLLSCSLHECHDTLKCFVARGGQRNLRFFPVRHATNIGLRTPLAGPKSEMIARNTKPARARIIASSAALLELFGPEVVVSNSFSDKAEVGRIRLLRLRYGRI